MAVHEELEAILHRLQQMREQLLLIKADEPREDSEADRTTMPLPPEPEPAESSLR